MKPIHKRILLSAGVLTGAFVSSELLISHYLLQYAVSRNSNSADRKENPKKKNSQTPKPTLPSEKDLNALQNLDLETSYGNAWHDCIPYEEIFIQSYDRLRLYGELYHQTPSTDNYVIIVHGYKADRTSMYRRAYHFWQKGFNILMIDLRACGKSEGKNLGMGWLDRKDVLSWIHYLISINSNARIVLYGESMGAATVMMTSGEENLPENVKVCIEDCGYTSVYDIFHSEISHRFGIPAFPLLNTASAMSGKKNAYNFQEASALRQVAKSHVPTLFIHGTADDFVPFSMLEPLYEAAACPKDKLIVNGAAHCASVYYGINTYFQKIFSFIDKYIND